MAAESINQTEEFPNSGNSNSPNLSMDETQWAERSVYWLKKVDPKSGRFERRGNIRQPLILSGHGVRLRVERGTLLVQNGFTHYPQEQETWRFFPGDWRLPSRIVVLDVDGALSFDALSWLSTHGLPLVHINWRGEVTNVVGAVVSTSTSALVGAQLRAARSGLALRIAQDLILSKISRSMETLRRALPESTMKAAALRRIESDHDSVRDRGLLSIGDLLGVEGRVAQAYFAALRSLPISWIGTDRGPIPDEWRIFGTRASKVSGKSRPNRNATHPVHAMLNYAYAVLESQVQSEVIAAGLDPLIGLFHGTYRNKYALVYDLMEPLRPVVDSQILELICRERFSPSDVTLTDNGVCRLNPQLARRIVGAVAARDGTNGTVRGFVGRLVRQRHSSRLDSPTMSC